jgi:hypothetical protein
MITIYIRKHNLHVAGYPHLQIQFAVITVAGQHLRRRTTRVYVEEECKLE